MGRALMEELGSLKDKESGLRMHLSGNFYPSIPSDVQAVIIKEFKKYWKGSFGHDTLLKNINVSLKKNDGKIVGLNTLEKFDSFLEYRENTEEPRDRHRHKDSEIYCYGTKKQADKFCKLLSNLDLTGNEAQDRLLIQEHAMPFATDIVMYGGNSIYPYEPLIRDFKKLIKDYQLVNFTDELYKFFSLSCGSIAHYNKGGWFDEYPTVEALRQFFRSNEFGERVSAYQPRWKTDAIKIAKEMERLIRA